MIGKTSSRLSMCVSRGSLSSKLTESDLVIILTLLRNSLFNINKHNIFVIVIKAPKMGGEEVMNRVSLIIQCSM